jgi:hypothetical protein
MRFANKSHDCGRPVNHGRSTWGVGRLHTRGFDLNCLADKTAPEAIRRQHCERGICTGAGAERGIRRKRPDPAPVEGLGRIHSRLRFL